MPDCPVAYKPFTVCNHSEYFRQSTLYFHPAMRSKMFDDHAGPAYVNIGLIYVLYMCSLMFCIGLELFIIGNKR